MPDATVHEILLRGRIGGHVLGPFLDDFTVEHDVPGVTRLLGTVRDAAHLYGLVAHLAAINAELLAINPVTTPSNPTPSNPTNH